MHIDEIACALLAILDPVKAIFGVDFIILPRLPVTSFIEEVVAGKTRQRAIDLVLHREWLHAHLPLSARFANKLASVLQHLSFASVCHFNIYLQHIYVYHTKLQP